MLWDKRRFFTRNWVRTKYRNNIGDFTYGRIKIIEFGEGEAELRIGRFCSIARGLKIFLGGEHRTDWITTYPFPARSEWPEARKIPGHPKTKGDVTIGNDVWIGEDVTILSGVTIGDGAVIGNKSLVVSSVEPYAIVGGNPAKLIRKRFDDKTIDELLKIRWWNWSIERIRANIDILCSSRFEELV